MINECIKSIHKFFNQELSAEELQEIADKVRDEQKEQLLLPYEQSS